MNTDKIYAQNIASEYAPKDDSKIVAIKKLDKKAKLPAKIFTYTFGIIGSLVLGVGMCLSMKIIGDQTPIMMVLGIAIGLVGILMVSINYSIYKKVLENCKKKYASLIVQLAKEITEE